MSIQGSVNQALSLAGILTSQSPKLKHKRAEEATLRSIEERGNKAIKALSETSAFEPEEELEYLGRARKASKQLFEASPTREHYAAYKELESASPPEFDTEAKAAERELYSREAERAAEGAAAERARVAAEAAASEALRARRAELARSRDFAKRITEGVYTKFNPSTYRGDEE